MTAEEVEMIKGWLEEAATRIRQDLSQELTVSQKSGRTDLVTNSDEETQAFLINKIKSTYPSDRILAEEKEYCTIDSLKGRVWIIDPIDGTLNFVLEKENFCVMLALFEDGISQLGFIYDVMRNELYWGGKGYGVYRNQSKLTCPADLGLAEGLVGMNAFMHGENIYHARDIGHESMGIRVSGCAGLELIAMLKGTHIGYVSNLSPWDYAAGLALLDEFGFNYSTMQGEALSFSDREYFLAATPTAFAEISEQFISANKK